MNNLAWGYHAAGKLTLALPLYAKVLKLAKLKFGPSDLRTIITMNQFSKALLQDGKPAKAEMLLRECLPILEKRDPDGWRTFDAKSLLGAALWARSDTTKPSRCSWPATRA